MSLHPTRRLRRATSTTLIAGAAALAASLAHADNVPQRLPFAQNWADTALLATDPEPQPQQDLRRNRAAAHATFAYLDRRVHRAQVLALDPRPHQARAVPRRQQRFQVHRTQLNLASSCDGRGSRARARQHAQPPDA